MRAFTALVLTLVVAIAGYCAVEILAPERAAHIAERLAEILAPAVPALVAAYFSIASVRRTSDVHAVVIELDRVVRDGSQGAPPRSSQR